MSSTLGLLTDRIRCDTNNFHLISNISVATRDINMKIKHSFIHLFITNKSVEKEVLFSSGGKPQQSIGRVSGTARRMEIVVGLCSPNVTFHGQHCCPHKSTSVKRKCRKTFHAHNGAVLPPGDQDVIFGQLFIVLQREECGCLSPISPLGVMKVA